MIRGIFRRPGPLAQRVAAAIRKIDPAIDVRVLDTSTLVIATSDEAEAHCSLDSLAEELKHRTDPEQCIEHYARSMIASARPMPDTVVASRVLPMVKPAGWAQASAPPGQQPLAVCLTDSVEIVFVEQRPDHLRFVAERHLAALLLDLNVLHKVALENLCAFQFDIRAIQGRQLWLATATDQFTFNATLALRADVWETVCATAGSELVCAIPERETCLFAREEDVVEVAELRDAVGPRLYAEAGYPVTTTLLRRVGGLLVEYSP